MSEHVIIVNAAHWLEDDGELPVDGPPELFRNALRMAQCIEYGGPLPKGTLTPTLIQCRWRPGGVACRATLIVAKTELDEIETFCLMCGRDEFVITNWQETMWAKGPPNPLPIGERTTPPIEATAEELPAKIGEELKAVLRSVGSRMSVAEIQNMIATTESPNTVIQKVLGSCQPRGIEEVQALANALMQTWNATPRAELGGQTPARVYEDGAKRPPVVTGPKISRNAPCPCGSGIKHKKCCGLH